MDPRPSPSMARLAERVAAETGERSASLGAELDRVFGAHEPAVRRIVRARLPGQPAEVVDELVQEVLLTAWRRLPAWRPSQPFAPFLFGVARFVCRNHARKRRDELTSDGRIEGEAELLSALDALEEDLRERVVLETAAEALEPLERQVVWLRWVEELDRTAIAAELGLAGPDEVRVILFRCAKRLRKQLPQRCAALGHGSSLLRGPGS